MILKGYKLQVQVASVFCQHLSAQKITGCIVSGENFFRMPLPRFSTIVENIGENRRISVSRDAKNSTVFPIPVKLWNFFLVLRRLGGLELQLKPVRNEGYELTVGRLSLGIADGIAKEALQGVQISPVPGYLDGVADGPFYP